MAEIFVPITAVVVPVRAKIRAPIVTIMNPYEGPRVIHFQSECIPLDASDKRAGASTGARNIRRVVEETAMETFTITDPIDGQTKVISVACAAMLFEAAFEKWFAEDDAAAKAAEKAAADAAAARAKAAADAAAAAAKAAADAAAAAAAAAQNTP